jgi:hypothetical protein
LESPTAFLTFAVSIEPTRTFYSRSARAGILKDAACNPSLARRVGESPPTARPTSCRVTSTL